MADGAALALACLVPAGLQALYLRGLFYEWGAPFNDTGLFAQIIHDGGFEQRTPEAFGAGGASFFRTHLCPALWIAQAASRLLSLSTPDGLALFQGLAVGTWAGACWIVVRRAFGAPRSLALAIAWLAAFAGIVMRATWNAHSEVAIPGTIALGAAMLASGRRHAAGAFFAATAALREDAAIHAALFVGALAALGPRDRRADLARWTLGLLLLGIGTLALKALVFPGLPVFALVYSGEPPYAHLDASALHARFAELARTRGDLWLVWALLLAASIALRERMLIAPLVATVPWLTLQVTAVFPSAARLGLHYGFPFLLALLAPCWAMLFGRARRRPLLALQALVVVIAALRFDGLAVRPAALALPEGRFGQLPTGVAATEAFLDRLLAGPPGLRCGTDSVASLRVGVVSAGGRIQRHQVPSQCEMVLHFVDDRGAELAETVRSHAHLRRCNVTGTRIVLRHREGCAAVTGFR
jgi:hypothetical protein